jgi:HPt (histidine-containing phosphotransfer) domain-containing protein
LEYLQQICEHDEQFVKKNIEIFVEQIPIKIKTAEDALRSGNYSAVKKTAHSMMLAIRSMGMKAGEQLIATIENANDSNVIRDSFFRLKEQCELAYDELTDILAGKM